MSKPKSSHRVFSRAFKLGIVNRMLAGEKVRALARELQFSSKDLYIWRDRFLSGGPEALRGPGRPRNSERSALRAAGRVRPVQRANWRRRTSVLPRWSARSASSRSNLIFFGKPFGRSGGHARRAPGPAGRGLPSQANDDLFPSAKGAHDSTGVGAPW